MHGRAPFKNLISHGFVLDESGSKMSKSKGNVVDPNAVCSQLGADVLRLWVSSADYSEDLRLGSIVLDQVVTNYRKIRNSLIRFSLANLVDFDYDTEFVQEFSVEDQYVLELFNQTLIKAQGYVKEYLFYKAIKEMNVFINFYSA